MSQPAFNTSGLHASLPGSVIADPCSGFVLPLVPQLIPVTEPKFKGILMQPSLDVAQHEESSDDPFSLHNKPGQDVFLGIFLAAP